MAIVMHLPDSMTAIYNKDGKMVGMFDKEGNFTKHKATYKFKQWVNFYREGVTTAPLYSSKNRNDAGAGPNRIACKLMEFEAVEGEGLESAVRKVYANVYKKKHTEKSFWISDTYESEEAAERGRIGNAS